MSSLPEDLEALLVGQPPVDWPGAVGAAVRGQRQRRQAVLAVAALLLVAVLVGALVMAGGGDGGSTDADQLSQTPTPSASAAPVTTRSPIADVVPVPVKLAPDAVCETTPPPLGDPPAVAQGAPTAGNVVRLSVAVSCTTIKVGQTLYVRAVSTATQDRATAFSSTLGDTGLDEPLDNSACTGQPLPDSGAGASDQLLEGSFTSPGTQRVTVLTRSPDACVARPGAASVFFDITVVPDVTATPTPTPVVTVTVAPTTAAPTVAPTTVAPTTVPPTTTPPPTTPAPRPTVNPALAIGTISTNDFNPKPGRQVTFFVDVSSNVGRPVLRALANGTPGAPICTPRTPYSYGSFSGTLVIRVTMPSKPGQVTVNFAISPPRGCPASGRAVVTRSSFVLTTE